MDSRLAQWKANSLSLAARNTLVASVVSALPSYAMQTTLLPINLCHEIDKKCRNFLWGSTSLNRKSHLVSWQSVCRRKTEGGLGLRQARVQNEAFMLKLGWQLIHRKDVLWVKFMREKYKCGQNLMPIVNRKTAESRTWAGIRSMWDSLKNSICWSIGHGRDVSFWRDVWVPHMDRLDNMAICNIPPEALEWRVSDCLSASGGWLWQKFDYLFPTNILEAISRVQVHSYRDDLPTWRWSSTGSFSLKSAYLSLCDNNSLTNAGGWRRLWKLKIPQRYRVFLWLCANDRILSNLQRFKRNMHDTGGCSICRVNVESTLHAVRDCPDVSDLWKLILPQGRWTRFFSHTLVSDWIFMNLRWDFSIQGYKWSCWFAILCRQIWLARNERVFNGRKMNGMEILAKSKACLSWGRDNGFKVQKNKSLHSCWRPPPHGIFKFNVDGSYMPLTGVCTSGGLLRSHSGEFVRGFQFRLAQGSSALAEAWAILWALKLSWEWGYRQIEVESDSSEVVGFVNSTFSEDHPDSSILTEIQQLLCRDWSAKVVVCDRESNSVADQVAAEARDCYVDFHVFSEPSEHVQRLIRRDWSLYCSGSVS